MQNDVEQEKMKDDSELNPVSTKISPPNWQRRQWENQQGDFTKSFEDEEKEKDYWLEQWSENTCQDTGIALEKDDWLDQWTEGDLRPEEGKIAAHRESQSEDTKESCDSYDNSDLDLQLPVGNSRTTFGDILRAHKRKKKNISSRRRSSDGVSTIPSATSCSNSPSPSLDSSDPDILVSEF